MRILAPVQPTGNEGFPSCSSFQADHLIYILPSFRVTQFQPNFANCIYGGKRLSVDLVTKVEVIIRQFSTDGFGSDEDAERRVEASVALQLYKPPVRKAKTPPKVEA